MTCAAFSQHFALKICSTWKISNVILQVKSCLQNFQRVFANQQQFSWHHGKTHDCTSSMYQNWNDVGRLANNGSPAPKHDTFLTMKRPALQFQSFLSEVDIVIATVRLQQVSHATAPLCRQTHLPRTSSAQSPFSCCQSVQSHIDLHAPACPKHIVRVSPSGIHTPSSSSHVVHLAEPDTTHEHSFLTFSRTSLPAF